MSEYQEAVGLHSRRSVTEHSTAEWKKIRNHIIRRDAYRCRVIDCTIKGSTNLTVHHIIPRSDGGGDHDANLITLCPKHHDEIEIAGVRVVALIEAWESGASISTEAASRTILDATGATNGHKRARGTKVHLCDETTIVAVNRLKKETGRAWTDLAKELGYPATFAATLSAVSRDVPGAISEDNEVELLSRIITSEVIPVDYDRFVKNTDKKHWLSETAGRTVQSSTRDAIAALHGEMSYPAIARRLNLERRFWPVLSRIVNGGPVSIEAENNVRSAMGMPPLPRLVETPACPDCGQPHAAKERCHGEPVEVVLLRPDQQVVDAPRPRPTGNRTYIKYWRACHPANLTPDQKQAVIDLAQRLSLENEEQNHASE